MKARTKIGRLVLAAAVAATTLALLVPTAVAGKKKDEKKGAKAPTPEMVWPLPPEAPRIRYVGALSNAADVEPPKKRGWLQKLVDEEENHTVVGMTQPAAVAVDSKDRVYVTDPIMGVVFVFDVANKKLDLLGASGRGKLASPFGVAVDKNDRVYVSDTRLKRVNVYDSAGELVGVVTRGGDQDLVNPAGLAVDEANGRLLVVDSRAHRLLAVDLRSLDKGVWLTGPDDERLYFPSYVAADAAGQIYVSDTLNFCVKVYDKDFKLLRRIGQHGTDLGNFDRPKGVGVDSEGNLYVVDAAFSNFQIFSDQGRLLLYVGTFGEAPGMFRLPSGMCVDKHDRIYVVDSINARVQIFQFLGTKGTSQGTTTSRAGSAPLGSTHDGYERRD
jgi:DNA-binding beta-propeller fold protein YncE